MSVYLFASIILLGVAVLLSLFLKTPYHSEYFPLHHTDIHKRDELVLKPGSQLVLTESN